MAELLLAYSPLQSGYSVDHAARVEEQILAHGLPRYRRVAHGGPHKVVVNWKTKARGYEYLMSFYNQWADNPNQPFKALLLIGNGRLEEYECTFAGGQPPKLNGQNGPNFTMSAEFYANPLPRSIDWEKYVLALKQDDPFGAANALERLVNKTLPKAWGDV